MLQSIEIHLIDTESTTSQVYISYRGVSDVGVPFYVETTALDLEDVAAKVAVDLDENSVHWEIVPDPEET